MGEKDNLSLATILADRGVRLTRQRRIVLDLLDNSTTHLNATNLLALAREQDERINRATVYRTVNTLKRAGLIDELDLLHMEGEQHYYERRKASDHVHICCKSCGRVQELETELVAQLADAIFKQTGFLTSGIRIEARAKCPDCLATAEAAASTGDSDHE